MRSLIRARAGDIDESLALFPMALAVFRISSRVDRSFPSDTGKVSKTVRPFNRAETAENGKSPFPHSIEKIRKNGG